MDMFFIWLAYERNLYALVQFPYEEQYINNLQVLNSISELQLCIHIIPTQLNYTYT